MAGKNIVPIDSDKLTVAQVVEALKSGATIELHTTDEDLHLSILEKKLSAATADEVLAPSELIKAKDNKAVIGVPFNLRAVEFRQSDDAYTKEGQLGIFAILHTSIGTIGCGSEDVVVTSLRLLELDALPRWVQITQDTTKGGNTVLNMTGALPPAGQEESF